MLHAEDAGRISKDMRLEAFRLWIVRVLIYILGLFFLAFGVVLSLNANLGISPVNSLPYVISQISGIPQGRCIVYVFSSYILFQIVLLRREFRLSNLTQLIFSTLFGYFVELCKFAAGDLRLPSYWGSLVMVGCSILVVALGVTLYMAAGLVPMPMEGLTLALARRTGKPFHTIKIAVDCAVVCLGIVLSFLFLGRLDGIREGTVLAAIATGKAVAMWKRATAPVLRKAGILSAKQPAGAK